MPNLPNPNDAPYDDRLNENDITIIEAMLNNGCADGRWLSTNEIRSLTNIKSWKAINIHLENIKRCGYVLKKEDGNKREYERNGENVIARRKILWMLRITS